MPRRSSYPNNARLLFSKRLQTIGARHALKARRVTHTMMISKEDAESNERLRKLIEGEKLIDKIFEVDGEKAKLERQKDTSISSHLKLDEDTPLLRFVHVDEQDCIGCKYCASVARNTFFMEDDAGRARVYSQGTDTPEIVMEAIDCCPVNCISYVSLEDLVILESERDGLYEGSTPQVINPTSIGLGGDSFTNRRLPSKSKGQSMMNCPNCPSRGCKDCPMYGVGLNPVYIARLEERAAKKEKSGEAAEEAFAASTGQMVSDLFDEATSRETNAEEAPSLEDDIDPCDIDPSTEECLDALFGDYAVPEDDLNFSDGPDTGMSEGPDTPKAS